MGKAMHNKKRILTIVGAFVFALLITVLLPGKATAVKDVEDMYAIVVTTGNDEGDHVTYFGLEYIDTDGYTHVEYVFPFKDGLWHSIRRTGNLNAYVTETPLSRGRTNTYFFELAYNVAEITGIDIYCQGEQGELYAWDVSGLRLYRVDQIIDTIPNGESNLVRFNGSQIAYLEERSANGVTFSWTGNTLFHLNSQQTSSYRLIFETQPYSMDDNHEYAVRIDLADVGGAGFEKLNQAYNEKKTLSNMTLEEHMAIQIEYVDVFGDARVVTHGVINGTVDWMLSHGISGDAEIAALAQQGDTIVFGCNMQDMQTINALTLYTGTAAEELLSTGVATAESISVTGVSIYPASAVGTSISASGNSANAPEYSFVSDPLYYYTSTTTEGEIIAENGSHYVSLYSYEKGAVLSPTASSEKYLIELIADPSQIVNVPGDVTVKLRYVDMTGAAKETEAYSVRNKSGEFYGYWPASTDDFTFDGQINSTDGICFVVELSLVEHFSGLTITVPNGSCDWQMSGFRVIRLDSLSKRLCVWEDISTENGSTNRRYYREFEGFTVFTMEERVLIQPGNGCEIDFVSQSVQKVEDFDWSAYRYAMTYEQCSSNLGLAKIRENYTVEVQVQSGATSLLDGYGDNGSKNRFYFMLEFENGVSGYVLANQQLSADGFRSGCTETFTISTNYDYGELLAVHVIPDDVSEGSDPYDKLNIAQIRVRRNDNGSISKEWVIQNVGWIGIDYRDEGAGTSISGQHGRTESEISRIYPTSFSSYALNIEFRIGTGVYTASGSGGPFYGTMEATLEYYNHEGKRKQLTFDVVRAMYDYANRTPVYEEDTATGSSGTPLAITDNSFMFRENHTDRFVISVSDVAKLGKLSLNMKSLNGGSLQITNVSAAVVMESGVLQINDQDEYIRLGETEYLCEDTIEKIPAFELFLPTDRNIYQDIYFGEHEEIKLDTKTSTWISAVSRVPNSQNDVINVFVYMADNARGNFEIDIRAQYTNNNGITLETGATDLAKMTDAAGKTIYAVNGLKATGMSSLNRVFIKAQSVDVVDAYIDHMIVQQVRAGVVINTFYLDCEHRNADNEFYSRPGSNQAAVTNEQKIYFVLGEQTESANLVSENRDIAVALQYTTVSGGDQVFTSKYIYITDQEYNSIKAGDIIGLTFNESYVQNITGILFATSGNVRAELDMACAYNYSINTTTGAKQFVKQFSMPVGAVAFNQIVNIPVMDSSVVEMLDIQFVTALSDEFLESGTNDPIIMVLGYTNRQGVQKELVINNIREHVVSDGEAFSTGSTTQIRLLIRDVASVQSLQLMPYNIDPQITAGWKPSQITVSVGADGSVQKVNRAVGNYIFEKEDLDFTKEITGSMLGGLKINLSNLIVSADIRATNEDGEYGNNYTVNSAHNKNLELTVSSGATIMGKITVSNSKDGFGASAEQTDGVNDISGSITKSDNSFVLTMPENKTGQNRSYRLTIYSVENENVAVTISVTVKSVDVPKTPDDPTGGSQTPTVDPSDPNAQPEDPNAQPDDPNTQPEDPNVQPEDPNAQPEDPNAQPEDPNAQPEDPGADPANPTE